MIIHIDIKMEVDGAAVSNIEKSYDLVVTVRHGMYVATSDTSVIVGLDSSPRGAALDYVLQDVRQT